MAFVPILFGIGTAATAAGVGADIAFKQKADEMSSKMAGLQAEATTVQLKQAEMYHAGMEEVITQQSALLKQISLNAEMSQMMIEINNKYDRERRKLEVNSSGLTNTVALGCCLVVSACIVGSAVYVVKNIREEQKANSEQE